MNLQVHLSPQLHQTIHTAAITQLNILQMSQQELIEHIHEQLDQNPFIEIEHERQLFDKVILKNSMIQSNVEGVFDSISHRASVQSSVDETIREQLASRAKELQQEWPILLYLIDQLDERLFLQVDHSFVAAKFQVNETVVQRCIHILQQLAPFGIAMENSKQFLIEQVKLNPYAPDLAHKLIDLHLEDLAKKKYRTIAKKYGCSVQKVEEAVAFIQTLSLYPSLPDDTGYASPIIPDAVVERLGDEWVIEMEQKVIPKISLNDYYHNLAKGNDWLNDQVASSFQEAVLLIQGLEARQQTLYKVLRYVVAHQHLFLEKGVDYLQPLTLSEVAQQTGLHESTISRAIREKFIQTPVGIFPIRALFKKGVRQSEDVVTAVHTIQKKIEQLILNEDTEKPLSDNQLMKKLQAEGISISRRTITKYREALGIPNSFERIRTNS